MMMTMVMMTMMMMTIPDDLGATSCGDSDDNYDPEEDESRMEIEEDSSDEAFEVGRSVSPKKKRKKRNVKRKKRLRSRNEYIDDGLEDEDGDDHFADLEDFVVD